MPKVEGILLQCRREVLPLPAVTLVSAAGQMLENPVYPFGTRRLSVTPFP